MLELTETRPVFDPVALDSAVSALRGLGLLMALDDLGEGFSGLRRWVDLRPDFVKIDRHFVDGVATDPLKQQFVRSILEMASSTGTAVIAEGLEQESDLRLMMGLGVRLCQGYLLARPSAMPRSTLRIDVEMLLQQRNPDAGGRVVDADVATVTAGRLAHEGPVARLDWRCDDVVAMFRGHPRLYALPVLDDDGRPIGLLRSLHVLHRGAERFFLDLHGRSSCGLLMDANPLVFDVGASLRTMSEAIANLDDRFMVDGFVVTREGRYVGVGRTSDLLKALSDLQVLTAQNVHPLTRLPGNLAIDRHLGRLLEQQVAFTLVVWSIPGLQDYTDAHGHAAGDDVIRIWRACWWPMRTRMAISWGRWGMTSSPASLPPAMPAPASSACATASTRACSGCCRPSILPRRRRRRGHRQAALQGRPGRCLQALPCRWSRAPAPACASCRTPWPSPAGWPSCSSAAAGPCIDVRERCPGLRREGLTGVPPRRT